MGRIGGGELLVILLIAILIFGPSKLAEMGKSMGEGLRNFKKGLSPEDEVKPRAPPPPPSPSPSPPTDGVASDKKDPGAPGSGSTSPTG